MDLGGGWGIATKMRNKEKKNVVPIDIIHCLSAKALAADLTNHNVADDETIQGEQQITDVHVGNNKDVRDLLLKNKVVPENLPPKEDIKKLERRVKREEKRLGKETGKLPPKQNN